ncbi:hypothetical protein [Amycolatopsis nigrescens]|uniref:hypothetical protein n=1 Tax=Amycolatopsis nigrescens TaxID=381445 RepID=UPI000377AE2D|nr:hypothetical protein [Amycolatopsis nigrescens]
MTQPGQQVVAATDTLKDVPPPPPIQVGTGGQPGGFKFEPEQVGAVITKWRDLLDELTKDRYQAEMVAKVRAPGEEFASGDFVKVANPSGQTLLEQNERMIQYVQNYISALESAQKGLQQGEDDAVQAVQKQGQGF